MLEQKLTVNCNELVTLDPFSLTFKEDEKRIKFLQYYSLIEGFSTNILKNYYPNLESSYSFNGQTSTARLTADDMTCFFSDNDGIQETKLELTDDKDGKSKMVLREMNDLYLIFNSLRNAKRKTEFSDLTVPLKEYSSDNYSLAVYKAKTGKAILFSNNSGKQVFLEVDDQKPFLR